VADRKRIFQVAYREEHFVARANLLRCQGYTVTSAIGNEAAKTVLPLLPPVDLFIIGHAAPEQTRLDMVAWLRGRYPQTSILAHVAVQRRALPTAGLVAVDRGGIGLRLARPRALVAASEANFFFFIHSVSHMRSFAYQRLAMENL
jgi:hypothetical protein